MASGHGDVGSFQYNGNITTMKVKNGADQIEIDALPDPSINVIASATSAAAGMFGSPTLFANEVENVLKNEFDLEGLKLRAVKRAVVACLPLVRGSNIHILSLLNCPEEESPTNTVLMYFSLSLSLSLTHTHTNTQIHTHNFSSSSMSFCLYLSRSLSTM